MAKTYFPFDAGAGANVVEADWTQFAKYFVYTGVIWGALNQFEVFADSSGMQVKAKSGRAFIRGHFFESDAEETLAIATSDPTNDRIDRIIVRVNWSANTIDLAVLTGTPAGSPTAPSLTKSSTIFEILLAQVLVDSSVGTIAAAKVSDEREWTLFGTNPMIQLYNAGLGSQAITTSTWTVPDFDSSNNKGLGMDLDIGNSWIEIHSPFANNLYYMFNWVLRWGADSAGVRQVGADFWDGSSWVAAIVYDTKRAPASALDQYMAGSAIIKFVGTLPGYTRFRPKVWHNKGSNLDLELALCSIQAFQSAPSF